MAAITLLLLLLSIITSTSPLPINTPKSFSAKLIHRDSPGSPFYNPTATFSDRRKSAHQRSLQRYNYLLRRQRKHAITPQTEAYVVPDDGEYLMELTVGTPEVTMVAIIDTGSELTWFQCFPCTDNCYSQKLPVFDPLSSTTYKTHSCDSDICHKLDGSGCNSDSNECTFDLKYADGSISDGNLAMDTFGLDIASDSSGVSIADITFGCSHSAEGIYSENSTGIIGLNMGPLSFISQLGDSGKGRFSYCFRRLTDLDPSGVILFGEDARLSGKFTPILRNEHDESTYYLNLLDISVDGESLNVPPGTFLPKANGGGGFIIDSGAEQMYLHTVAYTLVTEKLTEKVKLKQLWPEDDEQVHCYEGTAENLKDGVSIPSLGLHFEGELHVVLEPWHTFQVENGKTVCLAIQETEQMSTLGNLAQQSMLVGYDIKERKVYISPKDCGDSLNLIR